jgi:hypothetical protein
MRRYVLQENLKSFTAWVVLPVAVVVLLLLVVG